MTIGQPELCSDGQRVICLMPAVICDGGFGYKHYNGSGDKYSIGLRPGIELKLDRFSLMAHVGFLGYQKSDFDHGGESSVWGLDFDGSNISLGIYYNF